MNLNRRQFAASLVAGSLFRSGSARAAEPTKLSVSSWSFHNYFPNTRYGQPKFELSEWSIQDVVTKAKAKLGITNFEMSSAHLKSYEAAYLDDLMGFMKSQGCRFVHFCDNFRGVTVNLARADAGKRAEDLKRYEDLLPVAAKLGSPTMRVNTGKPEADGWDLAITIAQFRRLAEVGKKLGVEIVIENHGGLSADPKNVAKIVEAVGENISACPDFGLLPKTDERWAMLETMCKYAGRVCSAKFHGLDDQGNHADFDLPRCYKILKASKFSGWVSLEYEGPLEPLPQLERMLPLAKMWME